MSEINNNANSVIYTKSTQLREQANIIRTILGFLQELALNTAINSNNNNSSSDASVYQVIADEIKKNSDKMTDQLTDIDLLVDRLINISLDQMRYKKRAVTFIDSLETPQIANGPQENKRQIKLAINRTHIDLENAFHEIKGKVDTTSKLQSKLLSLNDKLWLALTSLKIENNLTNNTNDFFDHLAIVLDDQNEKLNNTIIKIGEGLMEISEVCKSYERSIQ